MISSTHTEDLCSKENNLKLFKSFFYKSHGGLFSKNCKFFYIVSNEWKKDWEKYFFLKGKHPGPIKNDVFFQENKKLKKGLERNKDYKTVNKYQWIFWLWMYGGGPCIKRNFPDIYSEEVALSENDLINCCENRKGNKMNDFVSSQYRKFKEINILSEDERVNTSDGSCAPYASSSLSSVISLISSVCDAEDDENSFLSSPYYLSTLRSTCKSHKESEASRWSFGTGMRRERRGGDEGDNKNDNILISKEHDIFNKTIVHSDDSNGYNNTTRQSDFVRGRSNSFCKGFVSDRKANMKLVDYSGKLPNNKIFTKYEPSYPHEEGKQKNAEEDSYAIEEHFNRYSLNPACSNSYAFMGGAGGGDFSYLKNNNVHSNCQKHVCNFSSKKEAKLLENATTKSKKKQTEARNLRQDYCGHRVQNCPRRNEVTGDFLKGREYEKPLHLQCHFSQQKEESGSSVYESKTSEEEQEQEEEDEENESSLKFKNNLPAGLRNMTNTCFMNAALQCFVGIPNFANKLNKCVNKDHDPITQEFKNIIVKLNGGGNSCSPYCIPDKLRNILMRTTQNLFENCSQQDSHEFIRLIIGKLQESLKTRLKEPHRSEIEKEVKNIKNPDVVAQIYWNFYKKFNNSLMAEFFAGQLCSRLECTNCLNVSDTYDPIWDLSISVGNERTTLLNELAKFFSIEELEYKCEKCKQKTTAKKQFYVTHPPRVLLIHLKRYSSSLNKIHAKVDFPLNCLNMTKHLGGAEYALVGVIQHWGSSGSAGHYIAYVMRNGSWYKFDDECVEAVSKLTVLKCDAYCLFYYRIS